MSVSPLLGQNASSTPSPKFVTSDDSELPPDERLYLQMCRVIDTPLAVGLLLVSFLAMNLRRTPYALDEFLALRITVKNLLLVGSFALCWRLASSLAGLYTWHLVKRRSREAIRLVSLCTLMSGAAMIFPAISVTGAFQVATIVCFWLLSMAGLIAVRAVLRSVAAAHRGPVRDILIIGSGPRAVRLFQRLSRDTEGRRVLGFVDSGQGIGTEMVQQRLLGTLEELEGLLMHAAVDEVLIALPMKSQYTQVQEVIRVCERVGVRAKYLADIFEHARTAPRFEASDAMRMVDMPVAADDGRLIIKRGIDLVGAAIGLLVLSPVMLIAAAAIKATSPGPIFFVQERYGYNRRRFKMYKFRSMVADAEQMQATVEGRNEAGGPIFKIRLDPRVTWVGRWLRRTSIDELPQLFNVIQGEMSLVGPRPMSTRDVHRFPEAALMRRFSVRPGITCSWQVSGRSNLPFDKWIQLDLQYIDEWSLSLDIRLLARTLPAVLRGTGAA